MPHVDFSDLKHKKIALVLSGGVVKAAAWHLGVALALEELGFTLKHNESPSTDLEISTYVGSSAGSLVNLLFASGFRPLDVIQAQLERSHHSLPPISYREMLYLKNPMPKPPRGKIFDPFEGFPFVVKQILKPLHGISGFFSTQGLYNYLVEHVLVSNDYRDYDADLFTVATQLDHSRKCIFSKYNYPNPHHDPTAHYYTDIPIAESVAASMSVPPFYAPYPIRNRHTDQIDYYIDGEIRETLSTHVAIDNKCDFIISSWTHTPYHYHDEIGSLVNFGLPAICVQAIYLMIQKKIVDSRAKRATAQDILDTVNDYMKQNNFSKAHKSKMLMILERKLNYNPRIKLIDIYPKHNNYDLFFKSSFSLSQKNTSDVVKAGYKRTLEVFIKHEWRV